MGVHSAAGIGGDITHAVLQPPKRAFAATDAAYKRDLHLSKLAYCRLQSRIDDGGGFHHSVTVVAQCEYVHAKQLNRMLGGLQLQMLHRRVNHTCPSWLDVACSQELMMGRGRFPPLQLRYVSVFMPSS
jgi:hypothetical protein